MYSNRNLELDRLRAMAVLMTVFCHLDIVIRSQAAWYSIITKYINGYDGVVMFFAISGYVISKTLIPNFDYYPQNTKDNIMAFWIKRFTRLMPMATLWLVIPVIATALFNDSGIFGHLYYNIRGAIAAFFYLFNIFTVYDHGRSIFGVYWTLSLEEQFYFVFPFFLLLFKTARNRLMALIIASLLLNLIPNEVRPAFRLEGVIYGVIIYLLTCMPLNTTLKTPPRWLGFLISGTLISAIWIIPVHLSWRLPDCLYMPITALISALLVFLAIQERGYILPFKNFARVLDWVGTRSYGIYLIHIPAFDFAFALLYRFHSINTPLWRGTLAFILTVIFVELCYRYIENPIREWGRKYASRYSANKNKMLGATAIL